MPFDLWVSFFIAAAILVVVPGPDNIFVTLQSAIYGPRAGIFVTLGLCAGVCFHTCLVSLGIATIVAASPILLFIIQCIGASYLLYLAWGAWHAPVNKGEIEGKALRTIILFSILAPWCFYEHHQSQGVDFFPSLFPSIYSRGNFRLGCDDSDVNHGADVYGVNFNYFFSIVLVCRKFG